MSDSDIPRCEKCNSHHHSAAPCKEVPKRNPPELEEVYRYPVDSQRTLLIDTVRTLAKQRDDLRDEVDAFLRECEVSRQQADSANEARCDFDKGLARAGEQIQRLHHLVARAEAKAAAEYEAHRLTQHERDALRAEVSELSQQVCDECNGSGWNENRVEGRHPCVCIEESEPYIALKKERDGFKQWKIDHERILDVSNQLFRQCRATIAHLLDDPETGQEGICRNMLRLADERDELRAEAARLKARATELTSLLVASQDREDAQKRQAHSNYVDYREAAAEVERLKTELAEHKEREARRVL